MSEDSKFDLNKIYTRTITKKDLIKQLKACYDKEFIVCYIPRDEDNADMLIRSKKEEIKNDK